MNIKITKNYFIFYKTTDSNAELIQISLQLDDEVLVKDAINIAIEEMKREIKYQGLSGGLEEGYQLYMANSKGKPKLDYGSIVSLWLVDIDDKQFLSQVNI